MAVKWRRPILIGGIGLSYALWLFQSLHDSVAQVGEFGIFAAIAVVGGFWLFQQSRTTTQPPLTAELLDREMVEKAIAQAEGVASQLETEAEAQAALIQLRERLVQLKAELDRQAIRGTVVGGKAVGKTTLIQVLESNAVPLQPMSWKETPALFAGTDAGLIAETAAIDVALASDLVLFVASSDLTDSEFQALQQLFGAGQRLILVFNKQDQYLSDERATVLRSLQQRMQGIVRAEDVVATAVSPVAVKVRQHQGDGSVQEWLEQPEPDIEQLTTQLAQLLVREGQQLVWATTVRSAVALKAEAKNFLNGLRRDRALPLIEQYQWIAAAAAFANPVPALDLLATAAVNAQMIVDLGGIYQQKFSLSQAQAAAGTLSSLMLKLGLVELSTKTIATVLKSHVFTFVAGGVVQGVSAAYLTRLAGLSLIEYLQTQELTTTEPGLNLDKLGQTIQNVFASNQHLSLLQGFVKQGVKRLFPESIQPPTTGDETVAPVI